MCSARATFLTCVWKIPQLPLAGRPRGVDAFRQADERDAERLELVKECDQVLQIPSEPIGDAFDGRPPQVSRGASTPRRRSSHLASPISRLRSGATKRNSGVWTRGFFVPVARMRTCRYLVFGK
jgi:hypothetical protein